MTTITFDATEQTVSDMLEACERAITLEVQLAHDSGQCYLDRDTRRDLERLCAALTCLAAAAHAWRT